MNEGEFVNQTELSALQQSFRTIVKNYLFNISSLANHNHFQAKPLPDSRYRYYHSKGFQSVMENTDNEYIVSEENYLEGSTRVFLINPMMKVLLAHFQYRNAWFDEDTFDSNIGSSNREYENGAYIEFILECNGKNIGCRYTRNSYSATEAVAMERDKAYRLHREPVPGFRTLNPVDEVWAIDWSCISDEALDSICRLPAGIKSNSRAISLRSFFIELFNETAYEIFVDTAKNAICEAQKIIALKAVPQLLPNNMLTFKDAVMDSFSELELLNLTYQFKPGTTPAVTTLSANDVITINQAFFDNGYRNAIVGNSDFAKSFITSEYLFRSISEGLGIDYTSVVVGYLKSVEQLMQLLYESAFEGNTGMMYWDICRSNKKKQFNDTLPQYRLDPYSPIPTRKQEYFYHNIKTGNNAMEFGGLALFLRYYPKMWNVSESGNPAFTEVLSNT